MASSAYKVVKTYLHKEKDKDLITFIEDQPDCLRQKYLREALRHYRKLLEGDDAPRHLIESAAPSGLTKAQAGLSVLKGVSL